MGMAPNLRCCLLLLLLLLLLSLVLLMCRRTTTSHWLNMSWCLCQQRRQQPHEQRIMAALGRQQHC
jgi:hypothetical protein